MKSLVLVEHDNCQIKPATLAAVSAAQSLSAECDLLVMGLNCASVCEQAATINGINKVWVMDNEAFTHAIAELQSQVVLHLAEQYQAIVAAATTYGKNFLPRVAAKLNVGQVSDVTKVIENNIFEHPVYAGNAIETVKVLDEIKVLTIRPTAFALASSGDQTAPVENLDVVVDSVKTSFVSQELSQSERPELTDASIIVSGGRGLQSAEKFKLIEELADSLGAAVGASRAAVDAGFVPNDYQVGQTGKVVAPTLYIAVGISGAIQHLAGMKDSKVIVAINKDEEAPIFQIASYGLVGDLFEIVPEFIQLIKGKQ